MKIIKGFQSFGADVICIVKFAKGHNSMVELWYLVCPYHLIMVQVNLVNLYSSRFTANTDECTDIVVRKCALRHLTMPRPACALVSTV